MLKAVSLFSGCGGSDLGAKRAGVDIVFANDNYPPAARTYERFKELIASPDVDFRDSDIRDIRSFPMCDLLLGCYPCQSFTMGGPRNPVSDPRTSLYLEFLRALTMTQPKYFVAENVAGMKWLEGGRYLKAQLDSFSAAGKGYRVSAKVINAKDYGVASDRKRIFLVGVRQDLAAWYHFPQPTHGPLTSSGQAYASQGQALAGLPLTAAGEYYNQGSAEFSWWYLSRNRKRPWDQPSQTIVANWRHVPLHPASPKLRLAESDLKRKSWQRWEFTDEYDVPEGHERLERPRRLSWRESAVLQTFPTELEPEGSVQAKIWQIGNAVPPLVMQTIVGGLVSEACLLDQPPDPDAGAAIRTRAA